MQDSEADVAPRLRRERVRRQRGGAGRLTPGAGKLGCHTAQADLDEDHTGGDLVEAGQEVLPIS